VYHGVWSQVYESEQEYHDELSRLSEELSRCKLEASQHEAIVSSLRLSSDEKISRLQEDKAVLQVYLLVYLSVCLPVCVSACVCLFVCLYRCVTLSVCSFM